MEDSIDAILSARKFLLLKLVDPLTSEFNQLLSKITELDTVLLDAQKIIYFCSHCQKKHTLKTPPQKYQEHRPFAHIDYKFPPINSESFIHVYKMQIVGIYYANSADYLNSLPADATLELRPEPTNLYDNYAVAVYHQNQKLGYLERGPNQRIFNAIQQNASVQCVFNRFHPAHFENSAHRRYWVNENEYFPDRGNILISIYDYQKIDLALHNLIELDNIGHPHVINLLKRIGPLAIQRLSAWEERDTNPKITQTLNRLALAYQIPNDSSDTQKKTFSVML